ncbi:hypothetical protein P280DRAFT_433111 [Massarina eburnea CBS 473.64]|uniref:F-box domain-containing protein n=1 Tax=Massarina eburnea CBS 473.64 TaxID=1395130 RepID=A0A6A6RT33_9PLEO|nr:hypothetical protein P280DRAFT_433111 [Massarina eburnea CBS 473.64]
MARTVSAEEYEELGRTYYKRKQYEKAIEAFSSGIDAAVLPAVALFDYRAACQEKLENYNAAVKDGREAIRADKKDVRGYLRTGSALQKLDKLGTAVQIYKLGMKNVPISVKHFDLLQKTHNQLTRKLSPPKAIDPFAILPVELVEMIISYIPFKNVVNCLRVSKGWKNYLVKRPNLWLNLDLSEATKLVSRGFIRRAVQYSENHVNRLVIHRFQHTDMLRNIATTCKELRELEIHSLPMMLAESLVEVAQYAQNLKKLVIRTEISSDTVSRILQYRPTLEYVEFDQVSGHLLQSDWKGPFPHLHTAILNKVAVPGFEQNISVESLLEKAPVLQSIVLSRWSSSIMDFPRRNFTFAKTVLTSLELKRVRVPLFPLLPPTLKRLVILPSIQLSLPRSGHAGVHGQTITDAISWAHALQSRVSQLEHLVLRDVKNLSLEFLEALLDLWQDPETEEINRFAESDATPLKHLWLGGLLHESVPEALFGQTGLMSGPRILTPALQSLSINGMPCTDDDIEMLLSQPVRLKTLDISSTNVSGASLKMLADQMEGLQYLKADNCRRISSRDAVIYAEKRGISVSSAMNDPLNGRGGKKVRYG